MSWKKLSVPDCGTYLGTGVYYAKKNRLICSGRTHTTWVPEYGTWLDWLRRIEEENQGNTIQIWGRIESSPQGIYDCYALEDLGLERPVENWETGENLTVGTGPDYHEYKETRYGAGMIKLLKTAKEKGIYTTIIYCDAAPEWAKQLTAEGDWYLGYDFGERHTFGLDGIHRTEEELAATTLSGLAQGLVNKVSEHVKQKKADGWGTIMATNGAFHLDYEIAAGADVPVQEDFAFRNLTVSSAFGRGLFRQHKLLFWGSHLAHEHYSWIPYANKYKFPLLKAGLYLKYMHGAKMMINESGNWYMQAQLCTDSPMFYTPRVELGNIRRRDPMDFMDKVPEAQKDYPKIDSRCPAAVRYRKVISDFYDFLKANGTPEGQPEASFAIVKGNYDLAGGEYNPNGAIAGAYPLCEQNRDWFYGAPERSWVILKRVFAPCPPVLGEHLNQYLTATPHGVFDIVSFAFDKISAAMLKANYKALIFGGWNTCSDKQYEILLDYVRSGGILCIAVPHFSRNEKRCHTFYKTEELVNGGDLSELCGVKILGPGRRIYWGSGTSQEENELGIAIPRRFGILACRLAKLEITDPSIEVLAADDEECEPLIIKRKCGKGTVYLVTAWEYPGAMDIDEGPGAKTEPDGLMEHLYRRVAELARGHVFITDDGRQPGPECKYVACTYFPDAGKICLYNIDFERPHTIRVHEFGYVAEYTLAGGEFRMLDSVKLEPSEKQNWD